MWARGFTWFMVLQLGAGALSASHLRSSKAHLGVRSIGKRQQNLEQVNDDHVDGSALAPTQSAVEHVNKHPKTKDKKDELMERALPAMGKTHKAAAATTATSKKDATSKEVAAEVEEIVTIADAEATEISKSTEKKEETIAESAVETEEEEEEKTEETEETAEIEETEQNEETEEIEENADAEEAEDVEEAEDKDADQVVEAVKADAETEEAATEARDTADDEETASETEEAADKDVTAETEEESGEVEGTEKVSKADAELETEEAIESEEEAKTVETDGSRDETEEAEKQGKSKLLAAHAGSKVSKAKVAKVATRKHKNAGETTEAAADAEQALETKKTITKKARHSQKTTQSSGSSKAKGAQVEITENADAQAKSEEAHAEEHEDLPKLKAWTMMGRLFRRLHASILAFQGGSPEEVALLAQAPEEDQPSTGQVFSSLLLWSLLSGLVAYFYSNRKEKPGSVDAEKQNEGVEVFQEWKHGLFSCHEDTEVTLCALCCPGIRWAMTLSYVPGMLSFWVAFFIYICVELLGGLTAGTIGWVCLALLCTAYRQELRQKFNMERQGGMTYITDAMTYLCCTCCAIAQEARHVEDALKSGHPALQDSEEKSEAGQ